MLALAQAMLLACGGSPGEGADVEPLSSRKTASPWGTVQPGPSVDPASLALHAGRGVRVHERASVTGDVGVASSPPWRGRYAARYALRLDERARVRGRLIASTVLLSPRALAGDVLADHLKDRGSKHGAVSPYVSVPPPEPLAALTAATTAPPAVTVVNDATLAAGEYGDVAVESGAVLRLAGGSYVFASLDVAPGASVVALSTSRVRVATRLTSGSSSRVAVAEGGGTAKDLLIEVAGEDASGPGGDDAEGIGDGAVSIGALSTVRAIVSAPLGRIVVGARASVTGALAASFIVIRSGATLTFEDGFDLEPPCPGGCDDGNRCTADTCDAGACRHEPVAAGMSCSDENVCNGEEACGTDGACLPGALLAVDDGNPCTADGCDPVAGVVHAAAAAGTTCDDLTVCNGRESCDGQGTCRQGTAPVADDGNPCTSDACDAIAGVVHTPLASGTSCVDANVCNGAETCDGAGTCRSAAPLAVDDANPCTVDRCDPVAGVTHVPIAGCPATSFAESVAHLYSGDHPTQTGVQPGAFDPARIAVVRGTVRIRDGGPLAGVRVEAFEYVPMDHPEQGSTETRADGGYDLVVNGGQTLTVRFSMGGHPEVDRALDVPANAYMDVPDVSLVAYDPASTPMRTGFPNVQIVRSTPVSDSNGARWTTLLFQPGTTATMTLASDFSELPLASLAVRATEFTVGPDGSHAMPADLPDGFEYQYAVEVSADDAILAGADHVDFSPPAYLYVENYAGFEVGWRPLPVLSYHRSEALWYSQTGSRIVTIVGVADGAALLDVDGDADSDGADAALLSQLGTYRPQPPELSALATLYAPGQTLWRVPVRRLGPVHCDAPPPPPLP